jgi:VCBS repeat-containing protein
MPQPVTINVTAVSSGFVEVDSPVPFSDRLVCSSAVLAGALSVTAEGTGFNAGSITTTFSVADKNFDFLAAGETLTIVYNVTITGDNGVSVTQPVTIIATGTNDAPVLAVESLPARWQRPAI